MSKIDYQALREAAEKATPGNWWIDSHGQAMVSFIDNEVLEVFVTDNKRDAVRHEDTGNLSRWRNDNDATFIATANPATVLALLDELERNQQYIKRRDQENEDIALTVGKLRVELEQTKSKLNEQREYYEGVISDGSKRIAELEEREILLPERSSMLHRTDFNEDYHTVMAYKVSEVIAAIRAAGIRIKGE
ncbi:ead/Ea22-like family protein [Escherichia coli]|nr:ead/Ea22-like family protein [Escherichia coli]